MLRTDGLLAARSKMFALLRQCRNDVMVDEERDLYRSRDLAVVGLHASVDPDRIGFALRATRSTVRLALPGRRREDSYAEFRVGFDIEDI